MDEMYGVGSSENLMIPEEYDEYNYDSLIYSGEQEHHRGFPMLGSDELRFQCSVVSHESASAVNVVQINNNQKQGGDGEDDEEEEDSKAKIASHPSYSKLLDAYIDCQKVGAPPEIACLLDEIKREKELCKTRDDVSNCICIGVDPELDEFMETYYDVLVKYKSDLSRPFDEATSFLTDIQTQLLNLCNDEVAVSSDEELIEIQDAELTKREDRQLKEKLLRMYGSHISSLRQEFTKKKKKGKLPKEARQTLLAWWNSHSKWPYPTEADKIGLGDSTGLDLKQINNWFINQRKRHWKAPDNMPFHVMDNFSANFVAHDHQ